MSPFGLQLLFKLCFPISDELTNDFNNDTDLNRNPEQEHNTDETFIGRHGVELIINQCIVLICFGVR